MDHAGLSIFRVFNGHYQAAKVKMSTILLGGRTQASAFLPSKVDGLEPRDQNIRTPPVWSRGFFLPTSSMTASTITSETQKPRRDYPRRGFAC